MKTTAQYCFSGLSNMQAIKEDKAVFRKLHEDYFKRLYLFAKQFISTSQDAEEIVSDVFLKVWNKRASLNEIDNLNSYLYIITRNQTINYLQKKSFKNSYKTNSITDQLILIDAETPEDRLLYNELNEELQQLISNLPLQCRKVFKLVKEDGLRYKEVADILNISVNTVDNHITKAVKLLRTELSKKFKNNKGMVVKIAMWALFLLFAKFFHFLLV
ncbi:RNA polymerase sigma-70 factor [Chondrinema litorale]|uniref:RNA polymerase sigma-70 factor n=1 Tax=Chondrinema litorale TaxID=2994555 RepID=UPI002542C26B|nr:RNA polymerase sigma-70 factor [Chondrinema litorale]UZR98174.1 RNA polymerase sigma-70 factor [Chondrinema litorale]